MTAVLILTTGRTIDKLDFDEMSTYEVGDRVVEQILRIGRSSLPVTVREIMRKDSLFFDDADRSVITGIVRDCDASRIVITHGTDTITDTATVLADSLDRTIVSTGLLGPACFAKSDASLSLGMAIATAQVVDTGVHITMDGQIFRAGNVRENRATANFVSVH